MIAGFEAVSVEGATIARWVRAFGKIGICARPQAPKLLHGIYGREGNARSSSDDYRKHNDDSEKFAHDVALVAVRCDLVL